MSTKVVASVAEVKAKFSAYVARAQSGDELEITSHGKSVARMISAGGQGFRPPASKTMLGRIVIAHYKHDITDIDDLLSERSRARRP